MEIKGTIKLIGQEETFNTFKKRNVVITTEEQYPQHISVEFVQDKTSLLDKFKVGQKVTVGINLRGREWTSPQGEVKYFNSIVGWRIEGDAIPDASQDAFEKTPSKPQPVLDIDDDLPF